MTIKKGKWSMGFMIILAATLLVACGKKSVTESEIVGTHEMSKPPPSDFMKEHHDNTTLWVIEVVKVE